MARYLITFTYDGSKFNGYQTQPNGNTIQDDIEKNLSLIHNSKVTIHASGRTDAGVHALNQKAHFDLEKEIPCDKLMKALNDLCREDIYIKKVQLVNPDFHARFQVVKKEYIYKINMGEYSPFDRNYIYQYNKPLNVLKMEEAMKLFLGTHNFKSFTKANPEIIDYIRTIYQVNLSTENNVITLSFIGSGFMRYMVRNMVGLLLEIGSGKREIEDVLKILDKQNRTESGITASPVGLYLKNVYYEEDKYD